MKLKEGTFTIKGLKEDGTGTVVFATLSTIDKDGDFTLPGAFGNQTAKLVAAHDWSAPSIGLAKVREEGNEAIADIQFNLDMPSGQEWYKSLKFNFDKGIPQEFSYGFDILEESQEVATEMGAARGLKKLKVWEVSPVMIGAGVNTRMLHMKSARMEDHGSWAEEVFEEYLERCKALATVRRAEGKEGRVLSRANRDRLGRLRDVMRDWMTDMDALLVETEPQVMHSEEGKTVNLALLDVQMIEEELNRARGNSSA